MENSELDFYREMHSGIIICVHKSTGFVFDYLGKRRSFKGDLNDGVYYHKLGRNPFIVAKSLIDQGTWMFEQINKNQVKKLENLQKP